MAFKDNLKAFRAACGFSQEDVAKVLGIDRSAYSYYESGKTEPSIQKLIKIARMYQVSTDTLVGNDAVAGELSVWNETDKENKAPVSAPETLRQCTNDERSLLALYRTVEDKNAAFEALKKLCRNQTAGE
ncbi:MAG TPA: hypothetical protein DDY98_05595 [Ruminococcaceae bacterium]|nr:hypothetical protein [Oscillospiraceae bacterium]